MEILGLQRFKFRKEPAMRMRPFDDLALIEVRHRSRSIFAVMAATAFPSGQCRPRHHARCFDQVVCFNQVHKGLCRVGGGIGFQPMLKCVEV